MSNQKAIHIIGENDDAGLMHLEIGTGRFLMVNSSTCSMLGYSETDLLQMSMFDIALVSDHECLMKDVIKGEISSYTFENEFVRRDGSLMWGRLSLSVSKGYILAWLLDISAQREVEEMNYKLQGVIEGSPNIMMITNALGEIAYVNPAFEELMGYQNHEMIGKVPRVLQSKAHEGTVYRAIWKTIKEGKSWEGEFRNTKKNGEELWQNVTIEPMFNSKKNISNYLIIAQDITEKIEMLNELRLAKRKAEEADRLKSEFLSSISHEIRTPLNSIIGFSQVIAKAVKNKELMAYSEIIKTQNEILLQVIDNLLDFSSMIAGENEVEEMEFDMLDMIKALKEQYGHKCTDEVKLHVNVPNKVESLVYSDISRIQKIYEHLISNALKFTAKGEVEFGFSLGENKELMLFVKDTGIGISKEEQSKIFEHFTKLDSFSQGTGIGLAMVKKLVESLEGTIEVHSELGEGSHFRISIPLKEKKTKQIQIKSYEHEGQSLHGVLRRKKNEAS